MKKLVLVLFVGLLALGMNSCDRAKANQQVVVSDDCGVTWKAIKAGEAVPLGTGNYCFMKYVMPNYPMQGQSVFVVNFLNKVRVRLRIDYDYSITEPLAFIKAAKRLGASGANVDSDEALNGDVFEGAENSVIDVRIKEVSKTLTENLDLVDADISDLEDLINKKANEILVERGVHLNFMALTLELDEQTRLAIDVATAMRIYQASGIGDLGKEIMFARAGATKVSMSTVEEKKE
jgi:hypothetical protein